MGVELGENCFVAAGSIVTRSFAKNSFIAGVPAVLKKTFSI
jgi:acetyltransferase-like isoleucine patch superfamily enzyme